jgi:hypothetical protein
MKKVLFASFALFLLVSFTKQRPVASAHKNAAPAGVAWQIDRVDTDQNVIFTQCENGREVFIAEITTTLDLHGVVNNNRSFVQGTTTQSATGYDLLTGEEFTLRSESKINANFPVRNGTIVVTLKAKGALTGNQGSVDDLFYRSHIVINPNGETVVEYRSFICEGDAE